MLAKNFDMNRAARMVGETELFTIPQVAQRNGSSQQTVRNHLAREARQPEFAARCRTERDAFRAEAERRRNEWADVAVSSLRALLATLGEAATATSKDIASGKLEKGRIRELAGAVKIIGELSLGGKVLFGSPGSPRKAPPAPEAPEPVLDS